MGKVSAFTNILENKLAIAGLEIMGKESQKLVRPPIVGPLNEIR